LLAACDSDVKRDYSRALIRPRPSLQWVDTEFKMSQRTAYNFMAVAEKFEDRLAIIASLGPTVLNELASGSVEVQAEVERRIAAGEIFTVAEVQKIKQATAKFAVAESSLWWRARPPTAFAGPCINS
jgi:hypothetical protein